MLPALFTGLYHWLRWVTDDQVARWELEDPARTFATLAPMVLARPRFLGLPSWWRRPPERLTGAQRTKLDRLLQQWAALQAKHESMRQRSLQSVFAQQLVRDQAFTLQSIQAGAQQLSNAPGRMLEVTRSRYIVPPLPGGPT